MTLRRQGFTLIEVMIASGIAVIVLVGALSAGVALQRRAVFEEQAMGAQEAARAVKDLLTAGLLPAGSGLGSARINVGNVAGVSADRYAVNVTTDAPFGADGTFALPPAPYAALISDSIDILSGDSRQIIQLTDCGGGPFRMYQGNDLCTVTDATAFTNRRLMVVNPALGVACYHVATFAHGAGNTKLKSSEGHGGGPPPATEPCEQGANGFWDVAGAIAMTSRGAAFRVNWFSGAPILELDADGASDPTTGWVPVSREVEQIKVRMGVATLANPAAPLVWFPDAAAAIPPIDTCTNVLCDGYVTGLLGGYTASDLPAADARRAKDALMRRVRLLEVLVTTRSLRRDNETAEPNGATFNTDAEGRFLDGYKRRTFSVGVGPRNLAIAGLKQ